MRTRKSDAIVLTLQTGLASLAGMLVVTGGIAHAQTVSESGKASAGDRNMAGEEILVTAQRRQERLIETPVTVSAIGARVIEQLRLNRSEEHTSELQSLMRISYAVFCLKKKKQNTYTTIHRTHNKRSNQAHIPAKLSTRII